MNTSELTTELSNAASAYALLSRLWRSEADASLLEAMHSDEMTEAIQALTGQATATGTATSTIVAPTQEELEVDFCHLFLGPVGHLPPYQSVWSQGIFQGAAATGIRKWLDEYYPAYEPPDGLAPDHLAVQFEIMSRILQAGTACAEETDQVASQELADDFFRQHIVWSKRLISMAGERCRTEFYRDVMTLTLAVVEQASIP